MVFLKWGCIIGHPFGITLSVDKIGADCQISQNVTIGTNAKNLGIGEGTGGHKPKLGNLVRVFPGAVISGEITIGNRVIIAANAFIDKDIPDNSIVYGINRIFPLQLHHEKVLLNQLWHCVHIYHLIPGLTFDHGKLFIDNDWVKTRNEMLNL